MKLSQENLAINKGLVFNAILEYKEDGKKAFVDFTGYTFKAQFRTAKNSLAPLVVTVIPTIAGLGQLKLSLTDAQTSMFPGNSAFYDVLAKSATGDPEPIFQGAVTLTDIVTQWENTPPVTTASILAGVYNSNQNVALSVNEVGAKIYYTLDGTNPTSASTQYASALVISETTTLKFFAVDNAGNAEAVQSIIYTIDKVAPTTVCNIAADATIATTDDITLTADETASIYYTTNGTTPTVSSTLYAGAFQLAAGNYTVKFFAVDLAGNVEPVKTIANVTVA